MSWLLANEERRIAVALVGLCALVYLPFAGNYGLWDPWEARYTEVARQMVARNDWISLWNPCSPLEHAEFWSKPVLSFWLIALSMKLFGLQTADPAEMTTSWHAEWAARLPDVLLSIATIWTIWFVASRLAGRRAAIFSALILATSTQWALITRQAMVDLPFVAPMTASLGLVALALLSPEERVERELPRRSWRRWPWPHARAFYVLVGLSIATILPQLVVFAVQLRLGVLVMLPYFAGLAALLWWASRARRKRELYLQLAYLLGGLATLAKGPAGLALPGLIVLAFLVAAGRARDIFGKLDLTRGALWFLVTAAPWYHAMLIRHGLPFWNEFIGDNYLHRAAGRHGDRGGVDYYVQWLLYATFPWSGAVAAALLAALRKNARRGLALFALAWIAVELGVLTAVQTKFHHYVLPLLPGCALLAGLFLDEMCRNRALRRYYLAALGVTFFVGYELSAFTPRILWLFNYDYVNMPGTGRPWPSPAEYGTRYEYSPSLYVLVALCALAMLPLLGMRDVAPSAPSRRRWIFLAWLVCLAAAIAIGPRLSLDVPRALWLVPLAAMLAGLLVLVRRQLAFTVAAAAALVWTAFVLDKFIVELSPHWAQKHVIGAYYAQRASPDEPLLVWNLFWHGETFYSKNQIYESRDPHERTVFHGDRANERFAEYLAHHRGRRMFFVVERRNFTTLRTLLPADARETLRIVDESDNKLYLAVAKID
jgi:4-amino-4-deoxy-L-arabinose transferase-like glycosyltransferase